VPPRATAATSDIFKRPAFARARRLCLALPETTETSSWGHPNFRAGGKTFCALEVIRGRPSIAFRLPPDDVTKVVELFDGFATPYGKARWASVWVDQKVDWTRVARLIEVSYRTVANKRMLQALDRRV
jgi:predicted DNA-binding protein (MmcQ/YjbR family)